MRVLATYIAYFSSSVHKFKKIWELLSMYLYTEGLCIKIRFKAENPSQRDDTCEYEFLKEVSKKANFAFNYLFFLK